MMASSEQIRTTQQLANAADAFVNALGALFPNDTFNQFFHGDTIRRAYWAALQQALDSYQTPDHVTFARELMGSPDVADELLKLFLPGQMPDYAAIAEQWAATPDERAVLAEEIENLFTILAKQLGQSNDIRLALQQLAQARDTGAADIQEDLNRLLDAALISGPGTANRQVRHLLALAGDPQLPETPELILMALVNLADYLAIDTVQAIRAQLEQIDDPGLSLLLIGRLAPRISALGLALDPLAVIEEVLEESDSPFDPALCAEVLLNLAPHLDSATLDAALSPLQERTLEAVQAIEDAASRVRALSVLIPELPPHLQNEAVSMAFEVAACCISNEVARATALSVLPPHLPPAFQTELLDIAHDLTSPDARVLLLGRMLPYLPDALQHQTLLDALNAVEQISGDDARAMALISLAPHTEDMGSLQNIPEALQQAITVTFSIARKDTRARTFAALAPYLSPEMLNEALQAIKSIDDASDRAMALAKIAPHLSDELSVAALSIAHQLQTSDARAMALSAIAPYLSTTARAKALADALAAALGISDRYERIVALVDLAPHLPPDLQRRALQEAMTATRSLPNEGARGRALIFLAPHLPADFLADALADVYTISDPMERVPALSAIIPQLPEEPRRRVAEDVLVTASGVASSQQRASILAVLAPVLPASLLDNAMQIAEQISDPYDRTHVLIALLPCEPERIHPIALHAARAVPDRYRRASALLELVPHTPPGQRHPLLNEALDAALQVEDDYDRASALSGLAPYLGSQSEVENRQQDALRLALDACLEITDPQVRALKLAQLASEWVRLLPPAQSYSLWRRAVAFLRTQPYTRVITDLAALSPVLEQLGADSAASDLVEQLLGGPL